MNKRIFAGIYPTGVVYSDRETEENGDYKRLGFLSFSTLKLDLAKDCPAELAEDITRVAEKIQDRRGEQFKISASGQHITLGK